MTAARFVSLALAVLALSLGGCATRIDREYVQNKDGVKEVDKSTCVGLLCGGVSSASRGTMLIVPGRYYPGEPSFSDPRYYGRRPHLLDDELWVPDRRFRGQWVPKPQKVVLGQKFGDGLQMAQVDGVWRVCTLNGGQPHSCTNQDNANNWPRR